MVDARVVWVDARSVGVGRCAFCQPTCQPTTSRRLPRCPHDNPFDDDDAISSGARPFGRQKSVS